MWEAVQSTNRTLVIQLSTVPSDIEELLRFLIDIRNEAERQKKRVIIFGASKHLKQRLSRLAKVLLEMDRARESTVCSNLFQSAEEGRLSMQPFGMANPPLPGGEPLPDDASADGGMPSNTFNPQDYPGVTIDLRIEKSMDE